MRQPIVGLRGQRDRGQHPGLILARYLAEQNDDGRDKLELLAAACAAGQNPSLIALYRRAFERWRKGLSGVTAEADLGTPPFARLIVGLGNKGVIEAGVRLHHIYGVPLIPGSALKGLASHYCHDVYGDADGGFRRNEKYHKLLFGTTEDGGAIRFEDAWLHPDSLGAPDQGLLPDVMTPHHQKWQTDPHVAPTDFDSPVPVPYISVAGGFHVALSWQGPEHPEAPRWAKLALALLVTALQEWGVGGKTSSGYGRLVPLSSAPAAKPAGSSTAQQVKRPAGTPTKVKIVGPRPKGGFDVLEEGRKPGTLTVGTPPPGVDTANDAVVEVLVHNDETNKPQYKWPSSAGSGPKSRR